MQQSLIQKIISNWKSGLTVGLVSVPLGISLAVAAHATPTMGIITAFWACLIASLFGGSNYNVVGPAGALAGLLYAYATTFGTSSLPMLAIGAGILILIGYVMHIEKYLTFIPGSALHGFILGVSITLILNQLHSILGLATPTGHLSLIQRTLHALHHVADASPPSLYIFLATLACLIVCAGYFPRLPGTIIVTPLGIATGYLCNHHLIPWQLQTLGSKFSSITPSILQLPTFHWRADYCFPVVVIAIVALLETLISAKIADGLTKTKHNKRKEVIGLGLANIITGLCGGIPVTAVLARTALNIKSGCSDKISATIASACMLLVAFFCLPLFVYLPLTVMAAILIFIAGRLLEAEHFFLLFKYDRASFLVALLVAFITIYEDPLIGILLGVVLSMLMFMTKLSIGYHEIRRETADLEPLSSPIPTLEKTLTYTVKGPLVYINAQTHLARLEKEIPLYQNIILDLHDVYFIDIDGVEALNAIVGLGQHKGVSVRIIHPNPIIRHFIKQDETLQKVLDN